MIRVVVFVSGLAFASLPIHTDGAPIVMSFPDMAHQLKIFQGSANQADPPLEPVHGLAAKFELAISKKCGQGGCPKSEFRLGELYWLPDLAAIAGPGVAPRSECTSSASVNACLDLTSSRRLLAGVLKLHGNWELAARTDCRDKGFPIDVSTSGREILVDAKDPRTSKPLSQPQPFGDSLRFETETNDLATGIALSGFPQGFVLHEANTDLCQEVAGTTGRCALLLIRFEPVSAPAPGALLAEHFEHLYDLMDAPPQKSWAPFLASGKYCDESKHLGGGHPRCLGGYVAY